MTGDRPIDVSVIIPAWKAAAFIDAAIASALASERVTVEVIVIDDASPDQTFATVQSLAANDPRVRVDRLAVNQGPSAARNRAIELARGRFIAVLDSDDAILPDRFRRLVDAADETGADIVADNMVEVAEQGAASGGRLFLRSDLFRQPGVIDLETWVRFNQPLKPGDCLGYLKPLFRRATLERLNVRYDEALRNSEDYYLVANMLAAGARMTYLPEAGYLYTRSATSTSHRLAPAHTDAWITAETGFRSRHLPACSGSTRAALAARWRLLKSVRQFVHAVEAVKTRKIGALARTLVSDPATLPFTFSWFARIAIGKVARQKAA